MLKLGLPLFFLGSPSVIDHIDCVDDIAQISNDTHQPVELIMSLVRNFKGIPKAITSFKVGQTEFEYNTFGYISKKLIEEYMTSRQVPCLKADLCH